MSAFNPARLTNEDMFKKATEKEQTSSVVNVLVRAGLFVVTGGASAIFGVGAEKVPVMFYLIIIIISGAMFYLVAFTFFVAAFSFMGRMIELWVLLIASPFAFMTFAFPALDKVEYAGWHSWSEKLLKTAFMAPIFMFFLYLISKLININVFKTMVNDENTGWVASILVIVVPTIVNMMLLLKAVSYAKKGAGQAGEMFSKFGSQVAGLAGGLAIGAATGGAALAGRATLGRAAAAIGSSQRVKEMGFGGEAVRGALKGISTASFDARAASKTLASASTGKAKTGGWIQTRKDQVEKRIKRAHELEVSEDDPLQQTINNLEMNKQELLRKAEHDIKMLETRDKVYTKRQSDARARQQILSAKLSSVKASGATAPVIAAAQAELDAAIFEAETNANAVRDINAHRKAIKDGKTYQIQTTGEEIQHT